MQTFAYNALPKCALVKQNIFPTTNHSLENNAVCRMQTSHIIQAPLQSLLVGTVNKMANCAYWKTEDCEGCSEHLWTQQEHFLRTTRGLNGSSCLTVAFECLILFQPTWWQYSDYQISNKAEFRTQVFFFWGGGGFAACDSWPKINEVCFKKLHSGAR